MTASLRQKLGHLALLHTWDTMVSDRWRWLSRHLHEASPGERLLDVGCGAGAFTIGAALRGYDALGLTWDDAAKERAQRRADRLGARARFRSLDVRALDGADDLKAQFGVVILCEVIEHVLDDRRLVRAAAGCLAPGGLLLLTTPNVGYRAIIPEHDGPFSTVEDGEHVRRGYTQEQLSELCGQAGLAVRKFGSCSGLLSQKASWVTYTAGRKSTALARVLTTPLHPLVAALDGLATSASDWPPYSWCLEAGKPMPENRA